VDESGDGGIGPNASEKFILGALAVVDERDRALRVALNVLNEDYGRDPISVLHWKKNIRDHVRRKHAVRAIADTEAKVLSVVALKRYAADGRPYFSNRTVLYLHAMRRLLRRVSWLADELNRQAVVYFSNVSWLDNNRLDQYVRWCRTWPLEGTLKQDCIRDVRIDHPVRIRGLQAADIVCGAVWQAFTPDQFGDYEPSYLMRLAPHYWVRERVEGSGFQVMGEAGSHERYWWWESFRRTAEADERRGRAGPTNSVAGTATVGSPAHLPRKTT
jgi:hypothetical protein